MKVQLLSNNVLLLNLNVVFKKDQITQKLCQLSVTK